MKFGEDVNTTKLLPSANVFFKFLWGSAFILTLTPIQSIFRANLERNFEITAIALDWEIGHIVFRYVNSKYGT